MGQVSTSNNLNVPTHKGYQSVELNQTVECANFFVKRKHSLRVSRSKPQFARNGNHLILVQISRLLIASR